MAAPVCQLAVGLEIPNHGSLSLYPPLVPGGSFFFELRYWHQLRNDWDKVELSSRIQRSSDAWDNVCNLMFPGRPPAILVSPKGYRHGRGGKDGGNMFNFHVAPTRLFVAMLLWDAAHILPTTRWPGSPGALKLLGSFVDEMLNSREVQHNFCFCMRSLSGFGAESTIVVNHGLAHMQSWLDTVEASTRDVLIRQFQDLYNTEDDIGLRCGTLQLCQFSDFVRFALRDDVAHPSQMKAIALQMMAHFTYVLELLILPPRLGNSNGVPPDPSVLVSARGRKRTMDRAYLYHGLHELKNSRSKKLKGSLYQHSSKAMSDRHKQHCLRHMQRAKIEMNLNSNATLCVPRLAPKLFSY